MIHSWGGGGESLPSGGFTIPELNGMNFNIEFSCIDVHLPPKTNMFYLFNKVVMTP